jgi:hypothetical protein
VATGGEQRDGISPAAKEILEKKRPILDGTKSLVRRDSDLFHEATNNPDEPNSWAVKRSSRACR